jgi:uncharacterized protein (TIGR03437 family)
MDQRKGVKSQEFAFQILRPCSSDAQQQRSGVTFAGKARHHANRAFSVRRPQSAGSPDTPEDFFAGDNLLTVLEGVSVKINGSPAYIYYISPTQLNVLTPDDMPSGPVQVQVTTASGVSSSFTATSGPVSPAFFLFTAKYPAAVHPSGVPVGKAGLIAGATFAPAKPGETILLFGTGFGATKPPLPAGKLVTTAEPLANTVQVTIGGQTARVDFAGVSGSGLDQFNVKIPPGLPDGDAAVVATVAGSTTQANLVHHSSALRHRCEDSGNGAKGFSVYSIR